MTTAASIADLVDTTTSLFDPPHEVTDPDKHAALLADMRVRGWQGPPLVTTEGEGGWSFTGAHRIAAVRDLWNDEGIEIEIPYVDIADLCQRYGIDWNALCEEHHDEHWAATEVKRLLPHEVVDYLGFDVGGEL